MSTARFGQMRDVWVGSGWVEELKGQIEPVKKRQCSSLIT